MHFKKPAQMTGFLDRNKNTDSHNSLAKSEYSQNSGRYKMIDLYSRSNSYPLESKNNFVQIDLQHKKSTDNLSLATSSMDYISNFNDLSLSEDKTYSKSLDYYVDEDDDVSISSNDCDIGSMSTTSLSADSYDLNSVYSYHSTDSMRSAKRRKISDSSSTIVSNTDWNTFQNAKNQVVRVSDTNNTVSGYSVFNAHFPDTIFELIKLIFYRVVKIFMVLAICLLLIFTIILVIIIYMLYDVHKCGKENNVSFPVNSVQDNLQQCLIGQEAAISVIADALNNHDSINLLWFVGPVGVGKTKAITLILNSINSDIKFHMIYGSLLPSDAQLLKYKVIGLFKELDSCKPNILIIDEFDEDQKGLKFLEKFFELMKGEKQMHYQGIPMKIKIIVAGTYAQEYILHAYTKHLNSSGTRDNFSYEDLRRNLKSQLTIEDLELSCKVTIVPFLPLEEKHLRVCINHEINYRFKHELCSQFINNDIDIGAILKTKNITLQYIYETVTVMSSSSLSNYSGLIMASGCKRVHSIVKLLLTRKSTL